MQPRWFETTAAVLAMAAAMSSCSSDDDGGMMGGGGTSPSGGGGSSGAAASGGTSGGGATGSADPPGFADDIWPILRANCANVSCHGDGSFLPQHAHSDVMVAYEEAQPVADLMAGRVSGQIMPIMPQFCGPAPGLGDCLSPAEVQLIQAWAMADAPY